MNSAISRAKKILLIGLIITACIGVDQLTKQLAAQHLSPSLSTPYLKGLVRLEYTENTGIFSSHGVGLSATAKFWLFTVGVTSILLVLLSYLLIGEKVSLSFLMGGSLVIGGGLSNVLDRLINHGAVIDYVFFVFGDWITDIFNLADLAISIGLVIMLLAQLARVKREQGEH